MILLYIFYIDTSGVPVLETQSVSSEIKTVATMPPGYFLVPTKRRTNAERIQAIRHNFNLLNKLVESIDETYLDFEKSIAYHASAFQCVRTVKAMDDLVRRETREGERVVIVTKLEPLRKEVEEFNKGLIEHIKSVTVDRPQLPGKNCYNVVIVGAGPAGWAAAVAFLRHEGFTEDRVVVVSDKYAEFPTRSGALNPLAMQDYVCKLGVTLDSYNKLKLFFTVRAHLMPSIKHVDIAGRAIYSALGGRIVRGRFDSYDQLSLPVGKKYASLTLKADEKEGAPVTTLSNLSCILITMGFNALFPNGIKREPVPLVPLKERVKSVQSNVLIPTLLWPALHRLRGGSFQWFNLGEEKTVQKSSVSFMKAQLFLLLTIKENSVLEEVLSQYNFAGEEGQQQRILLKLKLYLDCLNKHLYGSTLNWSGLRLRDPIKLGKSACYEFEGTQATAPARKIVTLFAPQTTGKQPIETKTVATWAGAAAMPFLLNGSFTERAATQAIEVVDYLIKYEFTPREFETGPDTTFNQVTQQVIEHTEWENCCPDQSKHLNTFLSPLIRVS